MTREQAFENAFLNLSVSFQRDKGTVIPVPAVTPRRYLTRKEVR